MKTVKRWNRGMVEQSDHSVRTVTQSCIQTSPTHRPSGALNHRSTETLPRTIP